MGQIIVGGAPSIPSSRVCLVANPGQESGPHIIVTGLTPTSSLASANLLVIKNVPVQIARNFSIIM